VPLGAIFSTSRPVTVGMSGTEEVEGVALVCIFVGLVLWLLVRKLRSSRPDFRIGAPLAVGFGLRLAAIAVVGATGLETTLRGGDEDTFLSYARDLASSPLGHGFLPHGVYKLHVVLFALELKTALLTIGAMRIVQVGIALTGVVLILAAVYDLAGWRAARLAAWVLALEPGSIFFNSALHKEPNMELAAGLFVFGGSMIWRRLDVRGLLICALGGVIAVETRPYAGWFLVAGGALLALHAALRSLDRPLRAMPVVYAFAVAAFVLTPVLLQASSKKNLQSLQQSQNANAQGIGTGSGGPNSDNLKLEQVDFSTRGAILSHLPQRIRDLVLEPYPWQLSDTSQRLGAIGTLFAYAILLLLIRYAWLSRGHIFPRAGPLLYPLFFLLVAYSLSVGNAGTGFRYRTHLITLLVATMIVLREHVIRQRAESRAALSAGRAGEPAGRGAPVAPAGHIPLWSPHRVHTLDERGGSPV
jgi:hypothetical protein